MTRRSKEEKVWQIELDQEIDAILARPELRALLEKGPGNAIKRGGEIFARFNRKLFPLAQQIYDRQLEEQFKEKDR